MCIDFVSWFLNSLHKFINSPVACPESAIGIDHFPLLPAMLNELKLLPSSETSKGDFWTTVLLTHSLSLKTPQRNAIPNSKMDFTIGIGCIKIGTFPFFAIILTRTIHRNYLSCHPYANNLLSTPRRILLAIECQMFDCIRAIRCVFKDHL